MTTALDKKLIDAARKGDLENVMQCVKQGASLNISTENGALLEAAGAGHGDCVRFLLNAGADINVRNEKGSTALMLAAFHGQADMAALLIANGADKTLRNNFKNDAAAYARQQGHADVLEVLTQKPDQIIYRHVLSDRVMEEVYNFPMRERVTLMRREPGGLVEAFNRESFADLQNSPGLRQAFARHKLLGGTLTESDVFDIALPKSRNGRLKPQ